MTARADLSGRRFGRLTAVSPSESKNGLSAWLCICDCGKETRPTSGSLVSGNTKSCGCLGRENATRAVTKHGETKTPEYAAWLNAKARCYSPTSTRYSRYGGRGIGMCSEWRSNYMAFLSDMGRRPSPKHSLDRIDVNANYSAGNCRWVTIDVQSRNRTSNVWIEVDGQRMTVTDAAQKLGLPYQKLARRIRDGWSVERAIQ